MPVETPPACSAATPLTRPARLRRCRMSVAVINCQAVNAKGKTTGVPVPTWLDVFLVEPAMSRGKSGSYTDQKDVYVEYIRTTTADTGIAGQVVRRDTPYLIR